MVMLECAPCKQLRHRNSHHRTISRNLIQWMPAGWPRFLRPQFPLLLVAFSPPTLSAKDAEKDGAP